MRRCWGVLAAVLIASCDNSPDAGGELTLVLESSRTNDGAIVVLVAGGPVTAVHSATHQVSSTSDASGTHIVIVGDITSGDIARLTVPDLSRASRYLAVVEQVADRASFVLLDPAGYHLTLEVPPEP